MPITSTFISYNRPRFLIILLLGLCGSELSRIISPRSVLRCNVQTFGMGRRVVSLTLMFLRRIFSSSSAWSIMKIGPILFSFWRQVEKFLQNTFVYQTTRRHTPEDIEIRSYLRNNLKPRIFVKVSDSFGTCRILLADFQHLVFAAPTFWLQQYFALPFHR